MVNMKARLQRRNQGRNLECTNCPVGLFCLTDSPDVLIQCNKCGRIEFRYLPPGWLAAYYRVDEPGLSVRLRAALPFVCHCALRMSEHADCAKRGKKDG